MIPDTSSSKYIICTNPNSTECQKIIFQIENTKLILSDKGFEFNGEIIKDAGKAYQLFINFMLYHKLTIY